ncbi:unnamed protein product [Victoria cruziana]
MDALNGGGVRRFPSSQRLLQAESLSLFAEAVHLVLSRWAALRLAVQNEWGGGNSRQKYDQLIQDLVSWFVYSNAPIYIDELEMMLDEKMVLCFNTEIEDGSVEELVDRNVGGSSDEEYEPALDEELD